MTRIRVLLLASVFALATACGKAPNTAAPATSDAAPPAPIAAPVAAEPAAEAAPAADVVEESASTEAAAAADNALGKEIVLPAPAQAAAAAAPAKAAAAAPTPAPAPTKSDWQYQEGKHFNVLTSAQGTSSAAGKIEVAEIFWFGCSHCYNLEPVLSDWVKRQPADVSFVRIPVMWNPVNEIHARVYYTAEALGKLPQITPAMFRAIHVDNKPMTEEKDIQKLFDENGVSADDFNKTFRSFSVESQLKRAKDLTVKYRVRGVPLLVVNGKYTTDGTEIHSHQDLLAITEELLQRERQRN